MDISEIISELDQMARIEDYKSIPLLYRSEHEAAAAKLRLMSATLSEWQEDIERIQRDLGGATFMGEPVLPPVNTKAHNWVSSPKYGGMICTDCGRPKGGKAGKLPCYSTEQRLIDKDVTP